jgi:hypothetical protein
MPELKRKVFVSYSHKDKKTADKLLKILSDNNISLWTDQSIRAGDHWASEIEKALDEASMYVLLITPDFLASDWAQYELGHAMARSRTTGAPIVPIILRDGPMPAFLERFLYLDARKMSLEEIADNVKQALASAEKQ